MSRRFQNPIQQGTDVLPNVMQAPPLVRVRGVRDGSPEAIALLQRYSPVIQGFLRSQRQNQEIGGMRHVRVMRDFGDGRVIYDRLFGRELLEIQLRPEILRQPPVPVRTEVFDGILVGTITVVASSAGHTYPDYFPDLVSPGYELESTLSATLTVGSISYSASVRASFRRSIALSVTIYQAFDEIAFTPEPGDSPIVPDTGYLIPWRGLGFVLTGEHSTFTRDPVEEMYEYDYYENGPREDYTSPSTDHRKERRQRVLASTAGVDLLGRIPVSASAEMVGTHDNWFLIGGEPRITTKWPVGVAVIADFYPRNIGLFSPYVKTWRGVSTDLEQRFTHRSFLSYYGEAGFFADDQLRTSVAGAWEVDVSAGLRREDLTTYSSIGIGAMGTVDLGTGL